MRFRREIIIEAAMTIRTTNAIATGAETGAPLIGVNASKLVTVLCPCPEDANYPHI